MPCHVYFFSHLPLNTMISYLDSFNAHFFLYLYLEFYPISQSFVYPIKFSTKQPNLILSHPIPFHLCLCQSFYLCLLHSFYLCLLDSFYLCPYLLNCIQYFQLILISVGILTLITSLFLIFLVSNVSLHLHSLTFASLT